MKSARKPPLKKTPAPESAPLQKTVNVRLNETQMRRLLKVIEKKGTSISAQVQMAISEYLERQGV